MELQEHLTKALTQVYASDPTAPSLIMAWLPNTSTYCFSIVRYTEPGDCGRVVCHVRNDDPALGLTALAEIWLSVWTSARDPITRLQSLLGDIREGNLEVR